MLDDYKIQQWLFDVAGGGFEFDLAGGQLQAARAREVAIDGEWDLDYTDARGREALRAAVADQYGRTFSAEQVLIANGAQEALYLFYRVLLSAGDHVITTVPGWQQSWEIPREIGADVTTIRWMPGTALDCAMLAAAVRPGTRLISLISPGNPSGRPIDEAEWSAILENAERHSTWILVDEEFQVDLRSSVVNRYPLAMSVSGLSKIYGMPGLRVGWGVAASAEGARLLERMVNYKRYLTMCNSSLSERIALTVLQDRTRYVERYRELLADARAILNGFAAGNTDILSLVPPVDTPFAWFDLHGPVPSDEFARQLLKECRVVVMPAEVFGAEHGFRLTYARPRAVLEAGLDRTQGLLNNLAKGHASE